MKVLLSPFLNEQEVDILDYLSEKISCDFRFFNEYRLSTLKTFPNNGEYHVKDVFIKIENLGETCVQNGSIFKKVTITIDGSEENVNSFFKDVHEYSKKLPKVDGLVNVLVNNMYVASWRVDEQIPKRTLKSITLDTEHIIQDFTLFLSDSRKEYYKTLEIPYNRIYMLHGPPGTGKTTLIHGIASLFNKNIANLDFNKDMDNRTFRECLRNIPVDSILCIEDIDCLFVERKANDSLSSSITFSGLLNTLDGLTRHDGLAIVITTNHLKTLDSALKRRVDYFMEFDYCKEKHVRDMFDRFLPNESNKWDKFWRNARNCKLTPNILQKYFIKYPELTESITEFSIHETTGNENMYN